MKTLVLNIIITLAIGINLHAATFPNRYVTNTDSVAIQFNRLKLTNTLTYFVATTGNDSNAGTNASFPLLTIQAGVDKASSYDFGTNNVTVQIADGQYQGTVVIKSTASTAAWQNKGGFLVLHGNDASPSNVILTNSTVNHLVVAAYGAKAIIASMMLTSTNQGNECLIDSQFFSYVGFSNLVMGACGANEAQLVAEANGTIEALGPYSITGGGSGHVLALGNGTIYIGKTVTITGTPKYNVAFAQSYAGGSLFLTGPFNGSVNGPKYWVRLSGGLSTFGTSGGAESLPGSSAGFESLDAVEYPTNVAVTQATMVMTNVLGTNGNVDSIHAEKYGNSTEGPSITSFHSRGSTSGSQSAMLVDDRLLFIGAGGSDGVIPQNNRGVLTFNAAQNWNAGTNSSYASFLLVPTNSNIRAEAFRINGDGTLRTFGFNTLVLGSITVGASPFTYTTSGNHSEFVYITGGTTSSVTVNGTQVATLDTGCVTVNLQPGESVVVTYTVAPTMKRKPY